jgi:hypothetical protein
MDENEPLWLFVDPLNEAEIAYMVTGATAAILYGGPRLTNDLDLVVELTLSQIARLSILFPEERFYCPPADVIAVEQGRSSRGHFNLIHHETGYKADIYLTGSDPFHAWGLGHRRELRLERRRIWVAPPEYVIVRKLEYHREGGSSKHLEDIRAMLGISGSSLDTAFLDAELTARGLADQWRLLQKE